MILPPRTTYFQSCGNPLQPRFFGHSIVSFGRHAQPQHPSIQRKVLLLGIPWMHSPNRMSTLDLRGKEAFSRLRRACKKPYLIVSTSFHLEEG